MCTDLPGLRLSVSGVGRGRIQTLVIALISGASRVCVCVCVCFLRGDSLYCAPDPQRGQKPLPQTSVSLSIQSILALTVP